MNMNTSKVVTLKQGREKDLVTLLSNTETRCDQFFIPLIKPKIDPPPKS